MALVAKRGAYMEEAAPAGSGKMVAVLNTQLKLLTACQEASQLGVVTPANSQYPKPNSLLVVRWLLWIGS